MSQRPLSKSQKTQLGILGTAAWQRQLDLGQVQLPGDLATASKTARMKFWIHQVIGEVTQRVCTAADMVDDEYLPVKARLEVLAGQSGRGYDTAHREAQGAACHRDPGCAWVREMRQFMAQAGLNEAYLVAIMKGKFRGCSQIERLSEWQLKQLHDTIVNRCRAKLGKGSTQTRNQKQRRDRQAGAGATVAAEQPPAGNGQGRTYILRPSSAPRRRPDPAPQADPGPEADPF